MGVYPHWARHSSPGTWLQKGHRGSGNNATLSMQTGCSKHPHESDAIAFSTQKRAQRTHGSPASSLHMSEGVTGSVLKICLGQILVLCKIVTSISALMTPSASCTSYVAFRTTPMRACNSTFCLSRSAASL